MDPVIVTIDGPAGSGKSTTARLLAQALGLDFLDTGAMYRGVARAALDRGLDTASQGDAVTAVAESIRLDFDWQADPPRLHIDGVDVSERLRDTETTRAVSDVAQYPGVRKVLVQSQRRIGREHPRLVTEGRDQGSYVFPEATAKFYLDADPKIRAARRAAQLRNMGAPVDDAELLQQILRRDERDASRPDGPLTCPADAIRIDTTPYSIEQVVERLAGHVRERLSQPAGDGVRPGERES